MKRFLGISIILKFWLMGCTTTSELTSEVSPSAALEWVLAQDVPAVSVAVRGPHGLVFSSAKGHAWKGARALIDQEARFHWGSDTKLVTAYLIGLALQDHRLDLNSPLGELLPSLAPGTLWASTTVGDLLCHRSGFPTNLPEPMMFPSPSQTMSRQQWVKQAFELPRQPLGPQGVLYSNVGYVVLGSVLEQLYSQTWEQLVIEKVATPLHLDSLGFGIPGTLGSDRQPWGHNPWPVPPGPEADNPPAMAPAGGLHSTAEDAARFAQSWLPGQGGPLTDQTKRLLLTPASETYSFGWATGLGEDGQRFWWHGGTNTTFASIFLIQQDQAWVAMVNRGDTVGVPTALKVVRYLSQKFPRNP